MFHYHVTVTHVAPVAEGSPLHCHLTLSVLMNLRKDVTHIQWNILFEIHLFSVICILLCCLTVVVIWHCSIWKKRFIYFFKLSPKSNQDFICYWIWVKPLCKSLITAIEALLKFTVFAFSSTSILNSSVRGTDTMASKSLFLEH